VKSIKVLIFGATGGTGHELVEQAIQSGHDVSVFVRRRGALGTDERAVRVFDGDVADPAAVAAALEGQDAALSALGAPTPIRPYPSLVEGVRNILSGMQRGSCRRFIYLSFIGVPESRDQFGFVGRTLIAPVVLRHPTEDHRLKEAAIQQSTVDWTIVRAPKLTNGAKTSRYRVGEHLKPTAIVPVISRADVAELMLKQLVDRTHVRRAISIMH
jgi:uncharacterized protein YbjT (DUF2867 family)